VKVASFQRRFARKASTGSHLLRKLPKASVLCIPLERSVRGNIACADQCDAELMARNTHALKLNA